MNVENILRVADAIEKHEIKDLGFNMISCFRHATDEYPDMSGHACDSVACIVGWAQVISGEPGGYGIWSRAELEKYLSIDSNQSLDLACPIGFRDNRFGPHHAVRTLRHLAATGEVVWDLPEEVA